MSAITRYFTTGGSSMLALDLSLGPVNLQNTSIIYRGTAGIDRVFAGSGLTFDYTQTLGGADKLYFNGNFGDYSLSLAGSVVTFTRAIDNTVIRVNGVDALDTLIFLNGSVSATAVRQYLLGNTVAPVPVGEVSALSSIDVSASHLTGLSPIRGFSTGDSGAVFGTVPAGADLLLRGTNGVETVFVKGGSHVDATQLLGSVDKIYMTGRLGDYTASVAGSVLTLSRAFDAHTEIVKVVGGDSLIFADGTVSSTALLNAVRNNTPWPVPSGESTPGVPLFGSVALTSDASADGSPNYYNVGDVVRASVTFSEMVDVSGVPYIQLNVGGQIRNAIYAAGSGSNTLHFDYTIGSDNDSDGISLDAGALQLNGAIIRTTSGERAIVQTLALTHQSAHRVDTVDPQIIGLGGGPAMNATSLAENLSAVHTFSADEPVTWSLVGGADIGRFGIDSNSGALYFLSPPNYEAPTDSGGDNTYSVGVRATDRAGNTATQIINVSVINLNDTAPVITSGGSGGFYYENHQAGMVMYTASAYDADNLGPMTYFLGGTDAFWFNINSTTGAVSAKFSFDFENAVDAGNNNTYDFFVWASDGVNSSAAQNVSVTIGNVNEAPWMTSPAMAVVTTEGYTGVLYTATGFDPDSGTSGLFYMLSGPDAHRFIINSTTGELRFATAPDFEAPGDADGNNVYEVGVRVSDGQFVSGPTGVYVYVNDDPGDGGTGGPPPPPPGPMPGDAVISMGALGGQLINPYLATHQTGTRWFYYWDRNGNGAADIGDTVDHNTLDAIFVLREGTTSETEGSVSTIGLVGDSDTWFHAAIIQGMNMELPRSGNGYNSSSGPGIPYAGSDQNKFMPDYGLSGTGYNDLTMLWASANGPQAYASTGASGVPPGWAGGYYWSATIGSGDNNHLALNLNNGYMLAAGDSNQYYVSVIVG